MADVEKAVSREVTRDLPDLCRRIARGEPLRESDREETLPDALEDSLEDSGLRGIIVLGSDQVLAGQFNEKIVKYTLNTLNGMHIRHRDCRMVVMGRRAAVRVARTKQEVEATFSLPGSVDAIVPTVQRLLVHVADWRSARQVSRMLLFNNRPTLKTAYSATMTQLYPIDLSWLAATSEAAWPSLRLPALFMEWSEHFRRLNRQYFFVTLYRAAAESLASEHAARLAAM
jgi:F-type H+-transporting ATPase subunit gamma